jgi:hypothetical protein
VHNRKTGNGTGLASRAEAQGFEHAAILTRIASAVLISLWLWHVIDHNPSAKEI